MANATKAVSPTRLAGPRNKSCYASKLLKPVFKRLQQDAPILNMNMTIL